MNALINANLRDALLEDLRELQALNQKALPHVNSLTYEDMLWFLDESAYFKAIGDIKGFLIALKPGLQYDSNNYRWFSSRYDSFFYIDRIIISEDSRRQELSSQLY